MNHLVIGSAGHIDHGKSSIIKSLTNIDPTRLKEEKEKNITIDLGFSYFYLDKQAVGIVDLPGHEKFVSNMIVGSSNIDMILFVIAADDGIMPQTIEHFEILSLLNIKHAIIVLNKIDLVSTELLEQRNNEIIEFFKETNFANSPIVKTSIYQENTIDELKKTLHQYIKDHNFTRPKYDIFRMAIDRSFTIKGLGTIVTGTSQGKELFINEELELYPSKLKTKVRNIQNHGVDVNSITSGHRTALQLSKISKEEIKRGDIIASVDSLFPSKYIDVKITNLKSNKALKNNQLIRVFHQTKEFIGRLKLQKPLASGKSTFASIFLQDDIYAIKGDLGIIRQFSPIKTIAGIEIINTLENKPKIFDGYYDQYLLNDISNQIINLIKNNIYVNQHQILQIMPNKEELLENLDNLIMQNKVVVFIFNQKDYYILKDYLDELFVSSRNIINNFHIHNPLLAGIKINDLYKQLNISINLKVFKALIPLFKDFILKEDIISFNNFKIRLTTEQKHRKNLIMTKMKHNGYSLYNFKELDQLFNEVDDHNLIKMMIDQKQIYIINHEYLILDRMYNNLSKILEKLEKEKGCIFLSDFKQEIDTSRKYALMFLEHFDSVAVTERIDDYRLIIKKLRDN
jgi:selenocysteine-specific elongation factor